MATFAVPARTSRVMTTDLNTTQHIADPEWELIDPIPDVQALFQTFNKKFFKGELFCVELEWSKKMYQCAGICYSRRSRTAMSCVIRLSEPLLKLRSRKELIETLLHEMIHAWNFVHGVYEDNGGHGKVFQSKMHEINRLAGTNITVYHSFHDEVNYYKTHWWRCDGPCQNRTPYYGYVKRTSNRAPSKNDRWWTEHQRTCGGTFIKIKEPEKKPRAKKAVTKKPVKEMKIKNTNADIRIYFPTSPPTAKILNDSDLNDDYYTDDSFSEPTTSIAIIPSTSSGIIEITGNGKKLGGNGNGRSRLLDMFDNSNKPTESKKRKADDVTNQPKSNPIRRSIIDQIKIEFGDDDDVIFLDDEFDDTIFPKPINNEPPMKAIKEDPKSDSCNCPVCNEMILNDFINQHLDECLTIKMLTED